MVLEDGEQLGILSRDEALRTAKEKGLDLVEITARASPPVCRIMDYGRFKYEQAKKAKAAKKHASTVELKEIKFRPKTDEHDLDFKIKHVRRFLQDGNKCRLVVIFRGREVVHPKTGIVVLDKVLEATSDLSQVEVRPNLEGKRMIMVIGPKPGVQKRQKGDQTPKRKQGKGTDKSAKGIAARAAAAAEAEAEALRLAAEEKALEEMNAAAEEEGDSDDGEDDLEGAEVDADADDAEVDADADDAEDDADDDSAESDAEEDAEESEAEESDPETPAES